ncbi:MAG TPA: hypothetical protein EYP98_18455 [Planctomycetes bacterium]|nr:hypothetical protein [Planctomycetota bacterium]
MTGTPQVGQTITFQLDGALPSTFAWIGFGPGPSQFDLGPLGIVGIDLLGSVAFGVPIDALGCGSISVFAPPGSAGAQLWCQALNTDLSNALTVIIAP